MDFPTKNGGSFHSYVNVYQRVLPLRVKKILSEPVLDHLSGNSSASKKSLSSTWGVKPCHKGRWGPLATTLARSIGGQAPSTIPCGFAEQNSAMNISQNYTNWQIGKGKRMVLVEHGILECHEVPHFQINPKSLGFSGGVVTTTHCFPNQKIPKKQK